ncbi:MAG: hypothetical protein R8P61_08565 [Bacteroidia bacterium]|nr:hypothetical protein [Bacteroidia bacterium]
MLHRRSRKLFKGISIGILLVEFVSILLAIYLGNLASDWSKESSERDAASKSLNLICKELNKNHEELQYYRKYYNRMLFLLDSIESIGEFEKFHELKEYQSINPPGIYTFAYDIAESSGRLGNVAHEKAVAIARIYMSLKGLNRIIEEIQVIVLKGELNSPRAWRSSLNFLKQPIDLFYRDYPMLESYKVCTGSSD